jgi:hypothetical protein
VVDFFPSGMMGDGAGAAGKTHVIWNNGWVKDCVGAPPCVQVTYTPGDSGWAGMYLQYPSGNWGEFPGRNLGGFRKLSFFARADVPTVIQFSAGGIDARRSHATWRYYDSFEAGLRPVLLTPAWKQFEIDLAGKDLAQVIGAFEWRATQAASPKGATFYLDRILYVK